MQNSSLVSLRLEGVSNGYNGYNECVILGMHLQNLWRGRLPLLNSSLMTQLSHIEQTRALTDWRNTHEGAAVTDLRSIAMPEVDRKRVYEAESDAPPSRRRYCRLFDHRR